jgi:hypothetical protein
MDDTAYFAGRRAVANQLLGMALRTLGYGGTEAEHVKWIHEREEAIMALREICEQYGDNDWDERQCLADVITKHLHRHLEES